MNTEQGSAARHITATADMFLKTEYDQILFTRRYMKLLHKLYNLVDYLKQLGNRHD